jgi:hypothetical protein
MDGDITIITVYLRPIRACIITGVSIAVAVRVRTRAKICSGTILIYAVTDALRCTGIDGDITIITVCLRPICAYIITGVSIAVTIRVRARAGVYPGTVRIYAVAGSLGCTRIDGTITVIAINGQSIRIPGISRRACVV